MTFAVTLGQAGPVSIEVFDLLGRRLGGVDAGPLPAGRHDLGWETAGTEAGTYAYRLATAAGVVAGLFVVGG